MKAVLLLALFGIAATAAAIIIVNTDKAPLVRCEGSEGSFYFTAGTVNRTRENQWVFEDNGEIYTLLPAATCELVPTGEME